MKKYILALICLISIGQQGLGESLISPEDRQYLDMQIKQEKEISIEDTLKDINNKIKTDNKNYELYYQRGNIYYNKSESTKISSKEAFNLINMAVNDFETSIKLNDEYSKSYISLSLALLKVTNVLNGMLLELDKDFSKNKYMDKLANKTSLYKFGRSRLEKMGKDYNAVLKNIKSLEQTVLLTKRYALESIKAAEELNDKDPYVYKAYTYYFMNEANFKNAEDSIKKALSIEPRNHELYNTYGILNLAERDYRSAESNFKMAIDLMPDKIEYIKNLSNIYLRNHESEKVFNLVNRHLEMRPENTDLQNIYVSALKLIPNNISREEKLNILINSSQNRSLFKDLASESFILMANSEKDTNKSLEYLKKSLDNKPENPKAKNLLVKKSLDNAVKQKNPDSKIKMLEAIIKENPKNNNIKLELAKSYKSVKNYDKAIKAYNDLIKDNQLNADYYYQRALLYALKKDKAKTMADINKAVTLNKKYKSLSKKEPVFNQFRFR